MENQNLDRQFAGLVHECLKNLGAKSDLLSAIGSWRDSVPDEEVLEDIKVWLESQPPFDLEILNTLAPTETNPACPFDLGVLNKLIISPLKNPINHSLAEIFKELRFGRTAADQKYLTKLIEELEG